MVTWPSAISTVLLSLRTHSTVVPCVWALPWLASIRTLYSGQSGQTMRPGTARKHAPSENKSTYRSSSLVALRRPSWWRRCLLFGLRGKRLEMFLQDFQVPLQRLGVCGQAVYLFLLVGLLFR